jgi:hypothetical protein
MLLVERPKESPIIEAVRPSVDEFVLLVQGSYSRVKIHFRKFPDDYPLKPPCWSMSGDNELDWLDHDPCRGAYGPHFTIVMYVDRLTEMLNKAHLHLDLKDYKNRSY